MDFITRHLARQPNKTNPKNLRTLTSKLEVRTLIVEAIWGKNRLGTENKRIAKPVIHLATNTRIHLSKFKRYALEGGVLWHDVQFSSSYGFLPALKLPGDSCEARFPLGKETASGRGKQHHCECTLTCEPKTHSTWENTMKVNPRNAAGFLRRAFSLKKTRKVGAVGCESYKFMVTLNARRLLPEKTHGIWKGFRDGRLSWKKIRNRGAVGRVSYEFTVTLNARRILPEKT